ncbi:hypothetical protein WH47_00711 [Habropoda laboriosa]|uniref:Meiosis-specific nuclear structural protein 1 n=1 Tax=Habropoda laboriosa TaxID=597456 RepID=A0A0L7QYG3_9HYME|nr:PREDICTED: vicilin-like seed storage protein At2g18540 [Habropoda laboriosa]KOC63643.1 hypothetical protein WH47_00711 [Habropoda laboriosa]
MIQVKNAQENYEKLQEQKAIEIEDRRRAMESRSAKKRHLRELQIERKQAERTHRLAKELARRKHIELQESVKNRKAKSAASPVTNEDLLRIKAEFMKLKEQDKEIKGSKLSSPWNFKDDSAEKEQEKKFSYKRDLQNQMIDNRRRQREKEEEKHRERKILEEVGQTMHKEDLQAEKKKKDTVALLQAEKEAFLKARQFWKEKRREVLKQEHDEIARIVAKKEAQQKKDAEGKSDTRAAKDALMEKMAKKLMDEERKKREREEICRELYLAEKENELANEEVRAAIKKKHTARELLQDMARSQKAIAARKAKEGEIDAAFAKYLADERKRQEEKDRSKEKERREKIIQYGNELRVTITKNRMDSDEKKRKKKCYSESTLETWKSQEGKNSLL